MAEFDRYSAEHKARCPSRGAWACDGSLTWSGNEPKFDYGPCREFVGRTCAEVFAEEQRRAAADVQATIAEKVARHKERLSADAAAMRRAAEEPAPAAEWRVVTEGVTQDGDRCATHPNKPPVSEGLDISFCVKKGCVIERRVPAEPEEAERSTVTRPDHPGHPAILAGYRFPDTNPAEPAAAPEAADADAPAGQVVGVKAWSLTFPEVERFDAKGLSSLALWLTAPETIERHRAERQRAEDAALGRLVRTVQERRLAVAVTRENIAKYGGSLSKALAFSVGTAVLATPHVPQYVADAALAEREARVAEARAMLAGGAK